jgi:type IV secretory pathway TraG/TraD family ATPase VirD4
LRNILLTNCGTHLLLPGAGLEETRFYSERVGDTTVKTTSATKSGSGLFLEQRSWTTSETRRRRLTAEELRTMERNQMLVLGSAAAPILVTTQSYEQDRAVRHLADLPFTHVTVRPQPYTSPSSSNATTPSLAMGEPGEGESQQKQPGPTIIVDADDHSGLALSR